MKKLLVITIVQLITMLTATKLTAQASSAFLYSKTETAAFVLAIKNFGNYYFNHSLTVSDRVHQKLNKEFANIADAKWSEEAGGYTVRFTSNGIAHKAFLTKRGNCKSVIRYYMEETLPAAIRSQVKNAYCGFDITRITEVRHGNAKAYLITIADKTAWKVIRVLDGEMDIWETYNKG